MSEHLSQSQAEDYCRQKLSVEDLLAASDHLAACESCRLIVERVLDSDETFFALRSAVFDEGTDGSALSRLRTHPTLDEAAGYVDGMLAGAELQVINDHLSSCEECALAVHDLRAFKKEIEPTLSQEYLPARAQVSRERWSDRLVKFFDFRRGPGLAFATALAVLVLAVTGWLVWRSFEKDRTANDIVVVPAPPPDIPPAPVIAELNDSEGRITLDREGKLSGADPLPGPYRDMIKEALGDQRIEPSPLLKGLVRPPSSLMSTEKESGQFSVIDPVGRVVLTDRPTFRWAPLRGATAYVVEVYDQKFNLVAASPQLAGNSWTMPKPLARGRVYAWQVKATLGAQEFTSPRPPAPQARLRILDSPTANDLVQARREYASSHLTLGLLYARAGLLQEAEQELVALQKANPGSEIASRLLANLRQLRR